MSMSVSSKGIGYLVKTIQGTAKAVQIAQVRAVNRVAAKTRTAASRAIRKQVKLPAAYVNQHLSVTRKATSQKPEATISGRVRPTRLARYNAKQLTAVAWTARGDVLRKIPPGRKQKGVRVQVKPGRVRTLNRAFLLPLRNQNRLMGIFIRTGNGPKDIEHRYGPSVDQVFKSVRRDLKPLIRSELAKEFAAQYRFASQQVGA